MEDSKINLDNDSHEDETGNVVSKLTPDALASKKLRFFNSLVDYGIVYLIGQFIMLNQQISVIWLGPIIFVYCFLFESIFGVTLGKIVTNTRVTDVFGNKPTIFSVFIRSLVRLIPFEALSFLSSTGRGWHDYFSGTYVIYKS